MADMDGNSVDTQRKANCDIKLVEVYRICITLFIVLQY